MKPRIRKHVLQQQLEKYLHKAGKIHLLFLYAETPPLSIFLIFLIFGVDIITNYAFFAIIILFAIYIIAIMFYNYKITKLKVMIKKRE